MCASSKHQRQIDAARPINNLCCQFNKLLSFRLNRSIFAVNNVTCTCTCARGNTFLTEYIFICLLLYHTHTHRRHDMSLSSERLPFPSTQKTFRCVRVCGDHSFRISGEGKAAERVMTCMGGVVCVEGVVRVRL